MANAYIDIENYDSLPTLMRFENEAAFKRFLEVVEEQGWNKGTWRVTGKGYNTKRRGVYGRELFRTLPVMTLEFINSGVNMKDLWFGDDYVVVANDVRGVGDFG